MAGSDSLKTAYIAPAAIALWRLEGSREQTSRSRWTTPRCQPAAGRHSETARRELADLGVERPAHGADLVLREPLYAHLAAIRSIFLVDTPLAHDSAPAAAAALSARE